MPLSLTDKERELLGERASELDAEFEREAARASTYHSQLLDAQSTLHREQLAHAQTTQDRDKQVEERTRAHRDSVTRAAVGDALRAFVSPSAFNDAVLSLMRTAKVERKDDGSVKTIQLEDGRSFASLEVAAEVFVTERAPFFHKDWSVHEQKLLAPGESGGRSRSTSAGDDFAAGLGNPVSLPVRALKPRLPASGASTADDDFAVGFGTGGDAA